LRDVDSLIAPLLQQRKASHLLRTLSPAQPLDATHLKINGNQYVNFCSNNYLGLSWHPRVRHAAKSAIDAAGFGSGAAALLRGHTTIHESAARAIAKWKGTQSAVLLPSGYQANLAAIQTLAAISHANSYPPLRFLVDKLVHASILDAVAATGLSMRVFPHNNLQKLSRLLSTESAGGCDVVITESIFSMDGDAADLRGILKLKQKLPFFLLLDEAHASGVYGPNGAGYAHALNLQQYVDATVVTLSKALGGIGGAICANKSFCSAVVNFGRAFIYSTSLPASAAAAAEAAIHVMRDEPHRQKRLAHLSQRARQQLSAAGAQLLPGDSPILCCILGSESAALHAADHLFKEGFIVGAVRPPTVAPNSSRLRISLCSEHTDKEVTDLLAAIKQLVAIKKTPAVTKLSAPASLLPVDPGRQAPSSARTNPAAAARRPAN
jgi:8-amino-7-oxononanoate synthase